MQGAGVPRGHPACFRLIQELSGPGGENVTETIKKSVVRGRASAGAGRAEDLLAFGRHHCCCAIWSTLRSFVSPISAKRPVLISSS
jgi:hypothetical protein